MRRQRRAAGAVNDRVRSVGRPAAARGQARRHPQRLEASAELDRQGPARAEGRRQPRADAGPRGPEARVRGGSELHVHREVRAEGPPQHGADPRDPGEEGQGDARAVLGAQRRCPGPAFVPGGQPPGPRAYSRGATRGQRRVYRGGGRRTRLGHGERGRAHDLRGRLAGAFVERPERQPPRQGSGGSGRGDGDLARRAQIHPDPRGTAAGCEHLVDRHVSDSRRAHPQPLGREHRDRGGRQPVVAQPSAHEHDRDLVGGAGVRRPRRGGQHQQEEPGAAHGPDLSRSAARAALAVPANEAWSRCHTARASAACPLAVSASAWPSSASGASSPAGAARS